MTTSDKQKESWGKSLTSLLGFALLSLALGLAHFRAYRFDCELSVCAQHRQRPTSDQQEKT